MELVLFALVFVPLAAGVWFLLGLWERRWLESITTRAVDRRFLRWQHAFFRGHYPLGHWRKPWSVGHLRAMMIVCRAILVLMVVVWALHILRRVVMQAP